MLFVNWQKVSIGLGFAKVANNGLGIAEGGDF